MEHKERIKEYAKELRLYNLIANLDNMIHSAQQNKPTYLEFITEVFANEVECRRKRDFIRRLSSAHLPARHNLEDFDYNFSSGINKQQMKELRELVWLEQSYNVILMGPSGTGKTFIAAGLVYETVKNGLKAYMMTMEEMGSTSPVARSTR